MSLSPDDSHDEDGFMSPGLLSPSQATVQATYMTQYIRTINNFTAEVLPREDFYREGGQHRAEIMDIMEFDKGKRPIPGDDAADAEIADPSKKKKGKVVKFGWIEGVFMRCLLNIWGVMLFLRLSWVIAQSGLYVGLGIIVLSNIVTVITTLSMSAVSTNGQIKGGGIYYMISRSLGPEFGGAIGLMFTLSNSVACAMYVVGFCESLIRLLSENNLQMIDGGLNDYRVIGVGTLGVLLFIAWIGMALVTKTQMALLVILIGSQVDFVVGALMGPGDDEERRLKGFTGLNSTTLESNLYPSFGPDEKGTEQNFFTVFGVFFPAVTGIVAGANLSGDLKDPGAAIPKGTLYAIGFTFITYIVYAVLMAACVMRFPDAESTLVDGTGFGLFDAQAFTLASAWGPLIYAGCFAATLSSAIASLVGAPRVLQALANDKIYPGLEFFGKGSGANNDPIRGYILCFVIAVGCVLIADLNTIGPITTSIFLTAYALINFSTFQAQYTKSPGWRPSFKYYNMWVSLLGTVFCIVIEYLISWMFALATTFVVACLYLYVYYHKPQGLNWGDTTQAASYNTALKSVQELMHVQEHVKNYRPQLLILSGNPCSRPTLVDFGHLVCKDIALMICGDVNKGVLTQAQRNRLSSKAYNWFGRQKIRAFYSLLEDESFEHGCNSMIQLAGLSRLKPNMVLMGYKGDWQTASSADLKEYFLTIHHALDSYLAVGILRCPEGLDYSNVIEDDEETLANHSSTAIEADKESGSDDKKKKDRKMSASQMYKGPGGAMLSKNILNNLTQFQKKQPKGFIDVWWLYDDGGLTLLLPYILTTTSQFSQCKLRVYSIASKAAELDREQRNMAALLAKFRIECSDVIVVPDVGKRAQEETKTEFKAMIEKFKTTDASSPGITDAELASNKEKTNRHLRLRELLQHHSKGANMVVMTLPMPRKGTISPELYMAWLESLTKDMPPFLVVRGNQTSVLTFYS